MLTSSHSVYDYFILMYLVNGKIVFYSCICLVDQYTFRTCHIIPRPPLSHQNVRIKSFSIEIFSSDVSSEWKDNILSLYMSGGSIYTVNNVIWSPDYYCTTAMFTLHTNPQCLNISFQCIHSMERQYPIPACSMDEYTFNNVLWFPVD